MSACCSLLQTEEDNFSDRPEHRGCSGGSVCLQRTAGCRAGVEFEKRKEENARSSGNSTNRSCSARFFHIFSIDFPPPFALVSLPACFPQGSGENRTAWLAKTAESTETSSRVPDAALIFKGKPCVYIYIIHFGLFCSFYF